MLMESWVFFAFQAKNKEAEAGTSKSSGDAEQSSKEVNEEEEDDDDDDDDLDMDELDELEASLSKTSIQIREPNDEGSSWNEKWSKRKRWRRESTCFVFVYFQ